jgi:MFS family permease
MTAWFRFLFSNKRLLNFGFLLNFFSAYGQTFFISIFVPFWVIDFDITNAQFGSMYASVTIASAFFLSVAGKYIDRMSLRKYSLLVFIGLAASVLFLSVANSVWLLGAALLLVRWLGQGMLTHTSSTGIAKCFDDNRGKALGFTALGHPAGQFFIPLAMAPLLLQLGWRYTLVIFVVVSAFVMIPSAMAIKPVAIFRPQKISNLQVNLPKEKSHLLSLKFWLIATNIFFVPFLCTAVFLYQYSIAEGKAWDREWVTFSFAFFAIANAITLLLSGNLVDKFGGVRLFPLYLVPAIVALVLMAFIDA